ncbi:MULTISPECIES: 2-oxo-4-hydroxy-4-carboxy-5-ureidoimidazoline decarboxylase [Bacillus]|uniref:2-oxo-4-hydroxy-4-carboxy-5-ureidoimidazoline decarboxylase n=1 Tax=Bacillus TaxID=1386 RepID=UPI00037592E3
MDISISLGKLNTMNQTAFIESLGWIYELSPWVAERTWYEKPFRSLDHLKKSMSDIVQKASDIDQLLLIRSHPDLAARIDMAEASVKEQSTAGLDKLTHEEYVEFLNLNHSYKEKFGFPFIIAVRNHDKHSIKDAMKKRMLENPEVEKKQAIKQINYIASHRLDQFINN